MGEKPTNIWPARVARYQLALGGIVLIAGFVLGYFAYGVRAKSPSVEMIVSKDSLGTPSALHMSDRTPLGTHQSYFSSRNFFDRAYNDAAQLGTIPKTDTQNVRAMVVPHHLLAAKYIAQAFNGIASNEIDTVVLLSPNHFAVGNGQIIVSQFDWDTPYGRVTPDDALLAQLLESKQVQIDETPFAEEHGISGLVPFVRRSFPNARIVPVVVKDTLQSADADAFARLLSEKLGSRTILIGSFDFSHYLPQIAADFHDAKSETVLHTFDVEATNFLDIDSKPGLRILLQYVRQHDQKNTVAYVPIAHTSSDQLLGQPDSFENTSYFTGYFAVGGRVTVPRVTLHAFGDIMLDRSIRTTLDKKGSLYPFEKIRRFMDGSDMVLANLEGPITPNKSKTYPGGPLTFTFDPKHTATLKRVGITAVSLANNHTLNFGAEGLRQTRQDLQKHDIAYFGDPSNKTELSHIATVRGMRVGFIGFHQFINNDPRIVSREITRIRSMADFIIVMPHWGNEYQTTAWSRPQGQAARQWIDAGADVVIGAHPHVVQPFELYKGKMIFYSLGNFVFDQQFSEDVKTELSLGLVIEPTKVMYYLFPMYNEKFQVELSTTKRRDALLRFIAKHSVLSDELRKQVMRGVLELPR